MKERFADLFNRYPALTSAFIVLVLGLLAFLATRQTATEEEVEPVDVVVSDTLALNVMCLPTLESLPLYHALESGMCDSIQLALSLYTETSQFDIDSIMRRTKRIDGAVCDVHRLDHYRATRRALPVTEVMRLDGIWRLVSSGQLRIRDVAKLKKRAVATARYATSSSLLETSLRGTGLKTTGLYHAQINDFGIRLAMLDEAQVDASMLPEPYASQALVRGHRAIWSADSVSTLALCFRDKSLKDKRKKAQVELLKKAYNRAAADLNRRGIHAADSALIKSYGLTPEAIDTLRLPRYHTVR